MLYVLSSLHPHLVLPAAHCFVRHSAPDRFRSYVIRHGCQLDDRLKRSSVTKHRELVSLMLLRILLGTQVMIMIKFGFNGNIHFDARYVSSFDWSPK